VLEKSGNVQLSAIGKPKELIVLSVIDEEMNIREGNEANDKDSSSSEEEGKREGVQLIGRTSQIKDRSPKQFHDERLNRLL